MSHYILCDACAKGAESKLCGPLGEERCARCGVVCVQKVWEDQVSQMRVTEAGRNCCPQLRPT